jgi:hypothetical protein
MEDNQYLHQVDMQKNSGVAVSGTRPCVLREYVYVNG